MVIIYLNKDAFEVPAEEARRRIMEIQQSPAPDWVPFVEWVEHHGTLVSEESINEQD